MNYQLHLLFLFLWVTAGVAYAGNPANSWLKIIFATALPAIWIGLSLLAAIPAFLFSRQKNLSWFSSLSNALLAFFHYPYFHWVLRLNLPLTAEEKESILQESKILTRVSHPSSILCPFCQIEIPGVLKEVEKNGLTVRKRPLTCPKCHTRLDVCRYCLYFEPTTSHFSLSQNSGSGRCSVIKKRQPVEEMCTPDMAQRLKNMGYDSFYAGLRIYDSFSPPSSCRQFQWDESKTKTDGFPCMGKTRYLLLSLSPPK